MHYGRSFRAHSLAWRALAYVCGLILFSHAVHAQQSCLSCASTQAAWDSCVSLAQTYCDASGPAQYRVCDSAPCICGTGVVPGFRSQYGPAAYPGTNLQRNQHCGFNAACPAAGTEGPNIEESSQTPPASYCSGPCKVVPSHEVCTTVAGVTECLVSTQHTGERCIPGGTQPEVPDEEPDPESCDGQGDCAYPDNNGNPNTPEVCESISGRCVPIAPNTAADPAGGCNVGSNGGICVGPPGGGAPMDPPRPPIRQNQGPALTGTATGSNPANPGGIQTQFATYGNPGGPPNPDGNGNCQGGSVPSGNVCVCPNGTQWSPTSSSCSNGQEEGDGREASDSTCSVKPPCSGDAIDCVNLWQNWRTRCALWGTEAPPSIDLGSDPLAEYGGADAFYDEQETPVFDSGGFGWSSSCPVMEPLQILEATITIPPVWCELGWVRAFTIAMAMLIAIRILGR